jgi:autotransporter-associated beta strand protein
LALALFALGATLLTFATAGAQTQNLIWSVGGRSPIVDGGGNWSNGSTNFYNATTSSPNAPWVNANSNNVTFGGSPTGDGGTVTLAASVRTGAGLTFAAVATPYTIGADLGTNTITTVGGITANNSATINSPVILGASQTWTVAADQTLSVNGGVSDNSSAYGLITSGSGTLVLSGNSSYHGNTTISQGTLQAGGVNVLPSGSGYGNVAISGTLDLYGNDTAVNAISGSGVIDTTMASAMPTLTVNIVSPATSTFSGAIQNTAGVLALALSGGGMLTLSGANTYSGGTTVSAGTLRTLGNNILAGGSLRNNATVQLGGNETVSSLSGAAGAASVTVSAGKSLTVSQSGGNTTYAGGVSLAAGAGGPGGAGGGLVKSGASNLEIDGVNSLGANSSVTVSSTGTLRVNASVGSTVGAGVVASINSGATLELDGTAPDIGVAGGNRATVKNNGTLTVAGPKQSVASTIRRPA